jgi:hypothetical protein
MSHPFGVLGIGRLSCGVAGLHGNSLGRLALDAGEDVFKLRGTNRRENLGSLWMIVHLHQLLSNPNCEGGGVGGGQRGLAHHD